ncbi:MAG: Fic family protein [Actinomycetota bacterium]|nr:Fic family protein [Actinomycetota bacterium]
MDDERLGLSPVGNLVEISGYDSRFHEDYRVLSFVPEPLPAEVRLSAAAHTAVAEAASWVGRADQAVKQLLNPQLMVRPTIRREAVDTSALEGTFAAFTDVLEADFLGEDELTTSVSEVRNFVLAAEHALSWIESGRPVTLQLIENLHKILVRGTPADNAEAGHVRTTQVMIGISSRQRVTEARFVPPPPGDLLRDGVQAWLGWIGGPADMHVICQAALGHYQFETLHPFNDGNGRLGRLIALLQLVLAGELQSLVMNLSPWLKEHQEEYQRQLFEVSATGDFSPWIEFFCRALTAHGREAVRRVHELLDLRRELIDISDKARVRGTASRLAGDLIGYPMLTATAVQAMYRVSPQAANTAVGRLADVGILRQRTEGRYARIFSCDRVLALLDRPYAGDTTG